LERNFLAGLFTEKWLLKLALIDTERKSAELVKLGAAKAALTAALKEGRVQPIAKSLEGALSRFRAILQGSGKGSGPFRTADLSTMAGVSAVSIFDWTENGLIEPDPAQSNGRERRYGFAEAFCAGLIGSLRRERCGLDIMKLAAEKVREIVRPRVPA